MQQAVGQFGAIQVYLNPLFSPIVNFSVMRSTGALRLLTNAPQQDAGMHLSQSSSSRDADERTTLMERLVRLRRLGSLIDSPYTPDRLMSEDADEGNNLMERFMRLQRVDSLIWTDLCPGHALPDASELEILAHGKETLVSV
jgi:hypothetical protein